MSSGVLKLTSALAVLNRLMAEVPKSTASAGRRLDYGDDTLPVPGEGRSTPAPTRQTTRSKPETLTVEERQRRAAEAREAREKDAAEKAKKETEETVAQLRRFRAGARTEFVAAVGDAAEDLDEAAEWIIDDLGTAGAEFGEVFDETGDEFSDVVSGAASHVKEAANRAGEVLDRIAGFEGDNSASFQDRTAGMSEAERAQFQASEQGWHDRFTQGWEGRSPEWAENSFGQNWFGDRTGGGISYAHAQDIIDKWVAHREKKERAFRGDRKAGDAARHSFAEEGLEHYFRKVFSQLGRLEDLGLEQLRRKRAKQKPKKKTARPPVRRNNGSSLP